MQTQSKIKPRRVGGWFLVALAFVMAITACAQEPTPIPEGPTGAATINVTLTEFNIHLDPEVVPTGPVRFLITNAGSVEHNLFLEPVDAIEDPMLDVHGNPAAIEGVQPGETVHLDFEFPEPGWSYQLGCHLPGHYEAGMVQIFTVGK